MNSEIRSRYEAHLLFVTRHVMTGTLKHNTLIGNASKYLTPVLSSYDKSKSLPTNMFTRL